MQVVILELFFCHLIRRHIAIQVFIGVIGHIHFDIAPELVIFGEHCDDRNLEVLYSIKYTHDA